MTNWTIEGTQHQKKIWIWHKIAFLMNQQDSKYQQKTKAISSAEPNYFVHFAMRHPVLHFWAIYQIYRYCILLVIFHVLYFFWLYFMYCIFLVISIWNIFFLLKGRYFVSSEMHSTHSHCAKMKVNEKKLSKCQFHFPRLLVACPMLKKQKKNFLSRWTAEIIQFIQYLIQMDRTKVWFFWGNVDFL